MNVKLHNQINRVHESQVLLLSLSCKLEKLACPPKLSKNGDLAPHCMVMTGLRWRYAHWPFILGCLSEALFSSLNAPSQSSGCSIRTADVLKCVYFFFASYEIISEVMDPKCKPSSIKKGTRSPSSLFAIAFYSRLIWSPESDLLPGESQDDHTYAHQYTTRWIGMRHVSVTEYSILNCDVLVPPRQWQLYLYHGRH